MRHKTNIEGGVIIPKHTSVGTKGAIIPPKSQIGNYCSLSPVVVVGSGTVVGDGVKVRQGVVFGDQTVLGRDARVRGTSKSPVIFGEGTTFGPGAELRHCHFKRGLRFKGEALIEDCIIPADVEFTDRDLITVVSSKRLKVDEPYPWPAKPDRHQRGEG